MDGGTKSDRVSYGSDRARQMPVKEGWRMDGESASDIDGVERFVFSVVPFVLSLLLRRVLAN